MTDKPTEREIAIAIGRQAAVGLISGIELVLDQEMIDRAYFQAASLAACASVVAAIVCSHLQRGHPENSREALEEFLSDISSLCGEDHDAAKFRIGFILLEREEGQP